MSRLSRGARGRRRRRRARARRGRRQAAWVAAVAKDLQAHRGTLARRRRRLPAGGGARARARDEPGARQRRRDGDATARRSKPRRRIRPPRSSIWRRPWTPARSTCWSSSAATRCSQRPGRPEVRASGWPRCRSRVYHGLYVDETANLCHWNVPEPHPLESWGDARAYDGTVTLIQPLIAPLYDGHSALRTAQRARRPARPRAARHRQGLLDAGVQRPGRLDVPRRGRQALHQRRSVLEARAARRLHPRHVARRGRPGHAVHAGAEDRRRRSAAAAAAGAAAAARSLAAWPRPACRQASAAAGATAPAAAPPPAAPSAPARPRRRPPRRAAAGRPRRRPGSRSSSGPTRPSGTAASRTTAGCRSCPSR